MLLFLLLVLLIFAIFGGIWINPWLLLLLVLVVAIFVHNRGGIRY